LALPSSGTTFSFTASWGRSFFDVLFFPKLDPAIATIAVFATFAIGFVARPLGGIAFGHFGDRTGRKSVLMLTLLLMGISTCAIGLLPTYRQIGIAGSAEQRKPLRDSSQLSSSHPSTHSSWPSQLAERSVPDTPRTAARAMALDPRESLLEHCL
jgi:MFS family permease